jgi:hypothetical protein
MSGIGMRGLSGTAQNVIGESRYRRRLGDT